MGKKNIYNNGIIAIDCETTPLNAVTNIVGFSISIGKWKTITFQMVYDLEKQISIEDFY